MTNNDTCSTRRVPFILPLLMLATIIVYSAGILIGYHRKESQRQDVLIVSQLVLENGDGHRWLITCDTENQIVLEPGQTQELTKCGEISYWSIGHELRRQRYLVVYDPEARPLKIRFK